MADKYWQNRRRKEAQKGKPVVTSTLKRIEFNVDGVSYTYEFRTDSRSGFAYIFKGNAKIYGPYDSDCTDEGRGIMKLLDDNKIIRNGY